MIDYNFKLIDDFLFVVFLQIIWIIDSQKNYIYFNSF